MDVRPRRIEYFFTMQGLIPYREWYVTVMDISVQLAIDRRLTRVERGLLGDCNTVGKGVFELRIHQGPGYRIYFGQQGLSVILLLCGGDKSTQKKDIQIAQAYWSEFLRRDHQ